MLRAYCITDCRKSCLSMLTFRRIMSRFYQRFPCASASARDRIIGAQNRNKFFPLPVTMRMSLEGEYLYVAGDYAGEASSFFYATPRLASLTKERLPPFCHAQGPRFRATLDDELPYTTREIYIICLCNYFKSSRAMFARCNGAGIKSDARRVGLFHHQRAS